MSNYSDELAPFLPIKGLLLILAAVFLGFACSDDPTPINPNGVTTAADAAEEAIAQPTDIPTPPPPTDTPTPTAIPPTPTPPLAALVNGEMITKAEYEADLTQFTEEMAAIGQALPTNYQADRLNQLIEAAIMRQAAAEWGIVISEEVFNAALDQVKADAEANGGYDAWLRSNQYTAEEFSTILRNQMIAGAVIEQVVRTVPATTEQVRARYLVVSDPALAQSLLDQARAGANFADLAVANSLDQTTAPEGGDLGFIMRGWLFRPEIEDVIFTLEPNQLSEVIPVDFGNEQISYYVVQVVEKDSARPLSTAQRDVMTKRVIEEWLGERLAQADIQTFE